MTEDAVEVVESEPEAELVAEPVAEPVVDPVEPPAELVAEPDTVEEPVVADTADSTAEADSEMLLVFDPETDDFVVSTEDTSVTPSIETTTEATSTETIT